MSWAHPDLTRELARLVEEYVGYSATMNFAGKRALWDRDDPQVLLMPEENKAPLIGWQAINPYWKDWSNVMEYIRSQSANHMARYLASDLAVCCYDMRWVAKLVRAPKPVSADVRVTSLWRKRPDGWRLFHLMESPIDGLTLMRMAYEAAHERVFSPTSR